MRIGILGSGDVAKALAGGFLKFGHDVVLGSRKTSKFAEWAKEHPAGTVRQFFRCCAVRRNDRPCRKGFGGV